MADFQYGTFAVTSVKILNRTDCCGERLSGAIVEINNETCGVLPLDTKTGVEYTIYCEQPITGETIKVSVENEYLQIAEIKVFGT